MKIHSLESKRFRNENDIKSYTKKTLLPLELIPIQTGMKFLWGELMRLKMNAEIKKRSRRVKDIEMQFQ